MWLLLALALSSRTLAADAPAINGHPIDPETYRQLVEHKFLPTRTTFLSDVEIAQKLDLGLPQLGEIKAALDKNDPPALEKALIGYLNGKLRPLKPAEPPKPVPGVDHPELRYRPEAWLGNEITFNVNGKLEAIAVGERADWFRMGDGVPDIAGWSSWGNILAEAYLASGDTRYAQGLLTYIRAFYRDCRPPVHKTTSWSGALGPWAVGGRGRATGLLQWLYQVLAAAPVTTDSDRTMFLKMIYEHAECMYRFSEEHQVTNFEFYPITVLALLARQFPEFTESRAWRDRSIERELQNMDDSLLDDGGAQERTEYNFAYLVNYTRFYQQMAADGVPVSEFRRKLERMYEWFMYVHSPLYQYPQLNIGNLNNSYNYIAPAAELFPEREDLVYYATRGARGKPAVRTARVLAHTGFLTMRSDWSPDALFMAMNYNGTLPEIPGTYPDLLSFGLWAHGRAYLTNAGTPVSYAHPVLRDWCTQTKASNTVTVDGVSQEPVHNSGRLQNWQDRAGFTYLASTNENYRQVKVRHRRAVLFLKSAYWVVFDRLTPHDEPRQVHEYWWRGHFQPMEITVDAATKTAASSVVDGRRLYVVPANPENLALEQGRGLMSDGVHSAEKAVEGPYVSFNRKSDQPVSFTVLLAPTVNNTPAPVVTALAVERGAPGVATDNAAGIRIRQRDGEDFVAIAETGGLRSYGPVATDGEVAYVRTEQGNPTQAGLVAGRKLIFGGRTLIETGPEIASASVQFAPDTIMADLRGHGRISVAAGAAKTFALNGKALTLGRDLALRDGRWEVDVPDPGPLELLSPEFSTDATAVYRAYVGFRPTPDAVPPWNPVLVSWQTPAPADAFIEYAPAGSEHWLRNTKPDAVADHRMVLTRLEAGTTYRIRIRSATDDGRIGRAELTYQCPK
ncbi:MAG: heparinase II/III family protein [Planctomycetia bacterium]|nr:heparinase II/III family protein [Planctomycetia bacterium]